MGDLSDIRGIQVKTNAQACMFVNRKLLQGFECPAFVGFDLNGEHLISACRHIIDFR
jgi:hypothetical protein